MEDFGITCFQGGERWRGVQSPLENKDRLLKIACQSTANERVVIRILQGFISIWIFLSFLFFFSFFLFFFSVFHFSFFLFRFSFFLFSFRLFRFPFFFFLFLSFVFHFFFFLFFFPDNVTAIRDVSSLKIIRLILSF